MHRFFARPICLGLVAFGCGSPGDLDRSQFPELEGTGYPDRVGAAGSGAGGTFGGAGSGNVGGSTGVGGTASGTGGSAPLGGTGGALGGSGTGGQSGTGQGGTGQGGTGQGGTGQGGTGAEPGGCPEDITELTNRPAMEGGCAGPGCHIPGGTPPDLVSPGIEARLLDVMASAACSGRPYVGATDSVIEEKLTAADPCGEPMPLFAAARLNAEDKACIIQWLDGVAAGM
jgi:hypothetical protein